LDNKVFIHEFKGLLIVEHTKFERMEEIFEEIERDLLYPKNIP
jgi:hypothetical protein